MRRLALAALLVAGACSRSTTVVVGDTAAEASAPSTTATEAAPASPPGTEAAAAACGPGADRLVVLDGDGNVVVMAPDGTGAVPLTTDAGPDHRYAQPTWSPTGEWVAWSEQAADGSGALVSARPDGSGAVRAATGLPPFYIAWAPDGSRLVHLGNSGGAETLALGLVDVAARDTSARLATGAPFYLAWAPDATRMLTHVGSALTMLRVDGGQVPLDVTPGAFQAPEWSPDGSVILVVTDAAGQRLVRTDGTAQDTELLAAVEGFLTFAAGRGSGTVAYQSLPAGEIGEASGLVVLRAGAEEVAFPGPVASFFWDPAGEQILFATIEQDETALLLRWGVWSDGVALAFDRVAPSRRLVLEYLPFFDQYARSLSFWAPDGSAFVYAGTAADGRDGVWVQVLTGGDPQLVSPGSVAAWSPPCEAAGTGALPRR